MASSPTMVLTPAPPSKLKLRPVTSPFKSSILQNEVAIITGGASGIGFEITRQLGLHGAKVVIMGRRAEVLEAAVKSLTSQGIQAHAVRGDVRSTADAQKTVAETVAKFGFVSMLVNSAAGSQCNDTCKRRFSHDSAPHSSELNSVLISLSISCTALSPLQTFSSRPKISHPKVSRL
jgi:short-subunit dehydrogenase involved in D-alanine esterification of teichoic acids